VSGSYAVGANYLSFTAGSAGAAGTGAMSIVALVNPAAGNNNAGFVGAYASATYTRGIGESSLNLYGPNDFSSGVGPLTQGNWYVVAVTKSSSTMPWRMHFWAYNATPGGSFTHAVAVGAGNQGNGSTITELRLGANGTAQSNGLIAVAGIWTSELTDVQIDTLVSVNLSAWSALGPAELISLENWNGSSGATVPVGTSGFSAATGTVSSGANPPSFNFSIGSSGVAPAGLAVPLALGSPTAALNRTGAPTGLAVPIASGTPTVALNRSAAPTGLTVPLALGTPAVAVARSAAPAGLAVPLSFGTPVAGAQAPYVTAVLTPDALPAAVLTPGGEGSTLTPGAVAPAALTPGSL
jgi:hypothetical protein